MIRGLLIEDEPPARLRIQQLLEECQAPITLVGEADTAEEAIRQIQVKMPDVLFLDIHLPDATGFEVLSRINYQPMVIFTTAYAEYAVQAFETLSVDYLVKPIRQERFEKAIDKLQQFQGHRPDYQALAHLIQELKPKRNAIALPIKKRDRILLVDFEDIAYLKAADKYVSVFTQDGEEHLLSKSMAQLATELPADFIRVHRSFLVNRNYIIEIAKHFKGRLVLKLKDKAQSEILTGETYTTQVKQQIGL